MSKKKQPRNGFYYFMLDMQQELREGGRFIPMKDLPTLAGPKWNKLSDPEKAAYNLRAKQEKGGALSYRPGKMDSTGQLLSERRDLAKELEDRRKREREEMRASFPPGKSVSMMEFFFIDILSLCELPECESSKFLPCELAVVKYSMLSGIMENLHVFINPGKIPMGYRFHAQSISDKTHQIPVEGFERAEGDYRKILHDVDRFVNPKWDTVIPPLYAKRANAERVEWCLQWLADKAGLPNRFNRIYEVESLIMVLYNHLDSSSLPPSFLEVKEKLETYVYDHEEGTRCKWHEEKESKYCSLATTNIYCYVISDCLCERYQIGLTRNHLPQHQGGPSSRVRARPPMYQPHTGTGVGTGVAGGFGGVSMATGGRGRGRGRGVLALPHRNPGVPPHET